MLRRLALLSLAAGFAHVTGAAAATCDSLSVLPLQNAHITSAHRRARAGRVRARI